MNRIGKWIASSLGYLLYTALVLSFLLWWLFPAESARTWLQQELNSNVPAISWKVGGLHTAWPLALVVSDISLRGREGSGEEPLLRLDRVKLLPDIRQILKAENGIALRYEVSALEGIISGRTKVLKDQRRLAGSGRAEDIHLEMLQNLWTGLDRTVTGTLSGDYSHDLAWTDIMQGTLQADLRVRDGEISLQQPVFNLPQLAFSSLKATLDMKQGVIGVSDGTVESKMLAGEYQGTVTITSPLSMSELKLDGFIEPRPELFGRLQNKAMVTLIKNQLQDNRLSFDLTGTFREPGIVFRGVSGVIDGVIQGSGQ